MRPLKSLLTVCHGGLKNRSMRKFVRRSGLALISTLCGIVLLIGAGDARAALQITVGNPGLTHFGSGGGVELDFGLTDQVGQPVGNITKDNVQVLEDCKG